VSGLLYADGYFPFCIQENAQDGLPVEVWDGVTYYKLEGQWPDGDDDPFTEVPDFYPSKTSGEQIDVLGVGTFYPVGFTFEELMFLYWRVRRFDIKPVDGPAWVAGPLDVFPIIEGGEELEITAARGDDAGLRPLQNAEQALVCVQGFYYRRYGDALYVDEMFPDVPGEEYAQITFSVGISFLPIGPVYRSGNLYYPFIEVEGTYSNLLNGDPVPYEEWRYFQKNIIPFKYKEEDWGVNSGFIDVVGPPVASFRLILKLPTRDVTIPFYAMIGIGLGDPLITLVIEPSKYFTYGGIYDEDTGERV